MENKKENEKNNNKENKNRTDWGLLRRFLKGSLHLFLISIGMSVIVTLVDMAVPQIIRVSIDNAIGGLEPDLPGWVMNIVNGLGGFAFLGRHLWIMAALMMVLALIRAVFQYGTYVLNNKASEVMIRSMRNMVFGHIEKLPYSWHMENHTGDIIQRCTSDIDNVRKFVAEQLSQTIRIAALMVLSVYFMMRMNTGLAFIAIISIPLILGYVLVFGKKLHKGFRECDETEGQVSAMVQENLTGVRVVRAFAKERYERDRFINKNSSYCDLWVRMGGVLARFFTVQDVISMAQVMLVITAGSVMCVKGTLSPGDLVAFIAYNALLAWPVRRLGRMLVEMSRAGVSIERIAYIMNSEPEKTSPDAMKPPVDGVIRFENVSFGYDDSRLVLEDINFEIGPGTTLGILGATGSGKSTMMLLLDKLYELPEGNGRISISGVDIRDIDTQYLRRNISMVLQDAFLFSRTISENIGISDSSFSMDQIKEAARQACFDENVQGFSKGYDTFVGERGVTLSGGQKQRAAIARTVIRQAPIMIFDDSLSAVDTQTDARIRQSLEKHFGRSTVIIISHRLTTVSKADKVIVLEKGHIAQMGTPEELKNTDGIYRRIYELQSGV